MLPLINSRRAFSQVKALGQLEVEEFWVLALRADKSLVHKECVFRGTVDCCPVFPRDVFRIACRLNASSLIVVHNHPSGELHPSIEDVLVTRRLRRAGRLFGIPVVDHIIVAKKRYWSFADAGWPSV